jgi:hypothetical protein
MLESILMVVMCHQQVTATEKLSEDGCKKATEYIRDKSNCNAMCIPIGDLKGLKDTTKNGLKKVEIKLQ